MIVNHPLFWNWLGWFIPLLLLGGLVVAVVYFMTRPAAHHRPVAMFGHSGFAQSDQAIAHARYRYASGQLGRDEYFQLLTDLGAPPQAFAPPAPPPPPPPPPETPPPPPSSGDAVPA